MTGRDCERVRDLLPDLVSGSIAPEDDGVVEAHLGICPTCRAELDVVEALRGARPEVPQRLEAKIQARVRSDLSGANAGQGASDRKRVLPFRRPWKVPAWGLSAAAVVVLALGTSVIWNGEGPDLVQDPIVVASQEALPESWLWDDGMVAGAPVFDGLSDEDLEALLEEFEG